MHSTITVGIATRDDPQVWGTIESLLYFSGHIIDEVLVVDSSARGSRYKRDLKEHCALQPDKIRYLDIEGPESSCMYRDMVFNKSVTDVTVYIDSHVVIGPRLLHAARNWWQVPGREKDVLTGPCYRSAGVLRGSNQIAFASEGVIPPNAKVMSNGTIWDRGAMGVWHTDEKLMGFNSAEIKQQGAGCVAAFRGGWPGALGSMRGHGGNETYTYERVRERGGRLMFVRDFEWVHSWYRPHGAPYLEANPHNRCRNYLMGFSALGRRDLWDDAKAYLSTLWPAAVERAIFEFPRP